MSEAIKVSCPIRISVVKDDVGYSSLAYKCHVYGGNMELSKVTMADERTGIVEYVGPASDISSFYVEVCTTHYDDLRIVGLTNDERIDHYNALQRREATA